MSFTAISLGNVIVSICCFFPPWLSYWQQRVHWASCVGFHLTEGRRGLGSGQVLALEKRSWNTVSWKPDLWTRNFRALLAKQSSPWSETNEEAWLEVPHRASPLRRQWCVSCDQVGRSSAPGRKRKLSGEHVEQQLRKQKCWKVGGIPRNIRRCHLTCHNNFPFKSSSL